MSVHDEHRMRLDKKVTEKGFEMLEPHEQLEHLLFAVIPRRNTNDIAHRLLKRFITISGVLNADVDELTDVKGVGRRTAMFLSTLPQLLGVVERSFMTEEPPLLRELGDIVDFAKTYFYGKLVEEVYLLSLNSSFRLLSVSKLSEGSQNEAFIYPTMVVKRAIHDKASVVIVVHNHPCGSERPSHNDLILSARLFEAFKAVDIVFLDSIIIVGGKFYSIAQNYDLEKLNKSLPEVK